MLVRCIKESLDTLHDFLAAFLLDVDSTTPFLLATLITMGLVLVRSKENEHLKLSGLLINGRGHGRGPN